MHYAAEGRERRRRRKNDGRVCGRLFFAEVAEAPFFCSCCFLEWDLSVVVLNFFPTSPLFCLPFRIVGETVRVMQVINPVNKMLIHEDADQASRGYYAMCSRMVCGVWWVGKRSYTEFPETFPYSTTLGTFVVVQYWFNFLLCSFGVGRPPLPPQFPNRTLTPFRCYRE